MSRDNAILQNLGRGNTQSITPLWMWSNLSDFFCFNCPLSSGEKQFKMKLLFLTTTFILACFSVVRCKPPNIVMFLTDDLDNQLGGLTPMTKTKEWIGDKGANFNNAFVVVPVCCPSRFTYLIHNESNTRR